MQYFAKTVKSKVTTDHIFQNLPKASDDLYLLGGISGLTYGRKDKGLFLGNCF